MFNKKEWLKNYREKNKEKLYKQMKDYNVKNKDKLKKYYKDFYPEFYKNNKKRLIKERMERTTKYRDIVYAAYGNVCNCCGETNSLFLTVDHVNNDGHKDKNKNGDRYSGLSLYLRIIKADFPADFQILCYNCNMGKARNKGVCPHKIQ